MIRTDMDVESRKVQKMGLSSLGVSLPKDWATNLGLEPGSTVELSREDDGTIKVSVPGSRLHEAAGCTINLEECSEAGVLERVVIGNYLLGRDSIEVRSDSAFPKWAMEEVYDAVDRLTGIAIVEQASRHVLVESFVEPTKFPVRGLLRRLQYLTQRMVALSFRGITKPGAEDRDSVNRLEEEVDRLYWLVTRQLMAAAASKAVGVQIGETDLRHIAGDMLVAAMLERVADVTVGLAGRGEEVALELSRFPGQVSKSFLSVGERVEALAADTMEAFFNGDVTASSRVLDTVRTTVDACQKLAASVPVEADVDSGYCTLCLQLRTAISSLSQMAEYYGTVAHVAINRALEVASPVCVPRAVERKVSV